jgi:putative alpha-1,2-mannosidase
LTLICLPASGQRPTDYTRWVNPFIGTGGHGHTFPGAVVPFGMVQLSPDTRGADWDGSSGYHYSDDIIYGFSHTHLSGTGIPDGCDILFMPMVGDPQFFTKAGDKVANGYATKFSHANEHAEPGYYSVKLDNGILAELTATPRVGVHRYTFSKSDDANIILDLKWRDKVIESGYRVTANTRIEGFRRSSSWAKDQIIYFVADFSKPFDSLKVEKDPDARGNSSGTEFPAYQRASRVAFQFNTSDGEQIEVHVGISSVSVDGARVNLSREMSGRNFDKVRADAKAAWNKELGKIEVSGGTDAQTTTFYTALYHTMIHPSLFNDVDGNYRGLDKKIHNIADDGVSGEVQKPARKQGRNTQVASYALPNGRASAPSENYSVFSLWDTFRAAHPLYTIIEQKRTVDFINTFIRQYEQGGRLPVWELWGNETDCMIGYHAVSVIADAMAKGIKGFDYEKAYEAAKHSAELDRDGLAAYKKRGYISSEDENESVSKTLEYAYDDWCIAQMADIMGKRYEEWLLHTNKALQNGMPEEQYAADYQKYLTRARSFENLFDPSTGFMRPKKNGGWLSPFAPNEVTFNYTEGNAWVYTFFVPQDITRLMDLEGGPKKFADKLDELFTTTDKLTGRDQPDITGLIGQYAHGNEPSHHIAYLYDYAGQPWKTQKLVRKIMDEFYKPEPDGLIGNEDCGQMSAWYVMSASGFYEVAPGTARYDLGTPLFKEVKFNLENGKTFVVKAPQLSERNIYIKSATLNGQPLSSSYIRHSDITNGGMLDLEMSDTPNEKAFTKYSETAIDKETPVVPVIEGERVFSGKTTINIKTTVPSMMSWKMESASRKTGFQTEFHPFDITETTTITAQTMDADGKFSPEVSATFIKRPQNWTVSIASKYSRQYTGGGDEGLIDGIRGTTNFASGEWQGYQGQDFVATVDLQKETEIHNVGAGFLQVAASWIWMPTFVQVEVSNDGVNFRRVVDIKTDVPVEQMEPVKRDYTRDIPPTKARYVRVRAYNLGKIPSWHPGARGNAWIFVDEILID